MGPAQQTTLADMDRARRLLDDSDFDAIVVAWPENAGYLSGFYHPDLHLLPERLHVVVWVASQDPIYVVPRPRANNWTGLGASPWGPDETTPHITDIRGFDGEASDAVRVIAEALAEQGVRDGLVGLEFRSVPMKVSAGLTERLPGLTYRDCWPLLNEMRKVKTPGEVELITRVNRKTAAALQDVLGSIRAGETERQVAARLTHRLLEEGADELNHTVFGGDCRGGQWHPWPSDRAFADGDVVRADWGIRERGYCSDIARTSVVGLANPQQRDIFARLSEVHDIVVDAIRPGVVASELYHLAKRNYERLGLEFRWPIVGHGIGLILHEEPHLTLEYDDPIVEGMMLEIELGWVDSTVGYHIEDLIIVERTHATNLTTPPGTRRLIESGRDAVTHQPSTAPIPS